MTTLKGGGGIMKEEVTFCDIRQILNILDLNLLLLGNIMVIKLLLLYPTLGNYSAKYEQQK